MCLTDILFWLHSVKQKKSVFLRKMKNGRTGFWNLALQLDPRCSTTDVPQLPQSATLGLHAVARKMLLISRPAEGRRLGWPEHIVG